MDSIDLNEEVYMREEIRKYIEDLAAKKNITIDNSTDLFETGILDSLGIVLLLAFIDEKLEIKLNMETLEADKFRTIDSIIEFLS